jgi:hypothetical protein
MAGRIAIRHFVFFSKTEFVNSHERGQPETLFLPLPHQLIGRQSRQLR